MTIYRQFKKYLRTLLERICSFKLKEKYTDRLYGFLFVICPNFLVIPLIEMPICSFFGDIRRIIIEIETIIP